MKNYNKATFKKIIDKFHRKKFIVIGDLLLDQYIWGEVSRISPEAPVPVVWVKNDGFVPGGACNVAYNLSSLGAGVSLVGIIGEDDKGTMLLDLLKKKDISTEGVVSDKNRPTILKTRVIAHHQQVVRIDREDPSDMDPRNISSIKEFLRNKIKDVDGVIVEDYGKGVITSSLLKTLVPLARKYGKIVAVDPKENHFSYYKGVSVITPNNHEAEKAAGFSIKSPKDLERAGNMMLKKLKAEVVLITLGEYGMIVFCKGKKPHRIPTVAQEVFDVSGAGDTVIAAYTLAVTSGASPIASANIANCAAGIVVGKIGTATVTRKELLDRLKMEIKN